MLINEIVIVEKINFDPNKVQNTKGPDGTLYKWDKNDQTFTAPNGQEIQSNTLLYRQLIKANHKATGKLPGGALRKAARAVGLGGVGKASRSDKDAGIMQKALGTFGDALGKGFSSLGKLGSKLGRRNKQQGTTQPAFNKGDVVTFISNHSTSKGKVVTATIVDTNMQDNPNMYQVKSATNPNPFIIPGDRLTKA